jgi:type VI protein secretion system component VasK
MPGLTSVMASVDQIQVAVYIVIGIIVIEGIWLAYLTWMMWKRQKKKKEVPGVEEEPESAEQAKKE